jgi:hypothetical protein
MVFGTKIFLFLPGKFRAEIGNSEKRKLFEGVSLIILCIPNISKARRYCENDPPSIG